ncbi:hypothetical protein ABVT39_001582 [Epinephelus coioides]
MKRKADDDDGSEDHLSKKSKPGWYRGKNICPATSSSTLYASTNIQARSAAVRNPPAQPLHQSVNSHSSKSSQAKSSTGSGVKRKADEVRPREQEGKEKLCSSIHLQQQQFMYPDSPCSAKSEDHSTRAPLSEGTRLIQHLDREQGSVRAGR